VPENAGLMKKVVVGDGFVCAIGVDDFVKCWQSVNMVWPVYVNPTSLGRVRSITASAQSVCAITEGATLLCSGKDLAGGTNSLAGVEQVSFSWYAACVLFQNKKTWCSSSNEYVKSDTRIFFDSKNKKSSLTGKRVVISGFVENYQFQKPPTIRVRHKEGRSTKWSAWSSQVISQEGRFQIEHQLNLTTKFEFKVSDVNLITNKNIEVKKYFTIEAIPKTQAFSYSIKRNYVNNFLQGATVFYSFKTDPRYQGACVVRVQTPSAFNFASVYMGPYQNSGFAKVTNGYCSGKLDVRYNGQFSIGMASSSYSTFTDYFKQETFFLKATG